jgi:gamma-glutamyltranspeptidase / glutathione hydrolase
MPARAYRHVSLASGDWTKRRAAWVRRAALFAALACALAAGTAGVPAVTLEPGADKYALQASALTGAEGGTLYLTLTGPSPLPDKYTKIRIKTFALDGRLASNVKLFDVPAPGGRAAIPLGSVSSGQHITLRAHFKIGRREHVVEAETRVRLRPDLSVESITAPPRVVRTRPFAVSVSVAEIGEQTGAAATLTLYEGMERLGEALIQLQPGGRQTVTFTIERASPGEHLLRAAVTRADPAESNNDNNARMASTEVALWDVDGAVSSQHALATETGLRILRAGGNAFDAAAAIQFVLNVVQPHSSGIGGGVTVLVRLADGSMYAIDGREKAPAATTPSQFVGLNAGQSDTSGISIGVPGTVATVDYLVDRWGTMPLAATLTDAIRIAEDGFPVGRLLAAATTEARTTFYPETRAIYRRPDGTPLQVGDVLKQPDMARTLRILAEQGAGAFYSGEIADALLQAQLKTRVVAGGGTLGRGRMTQADLDAYEIDVREPIQISYRGFDVVSVPPSSSGGVNVLQALRMLERFPLGDANAGFGFQAPASLHVWIEALRLAVIDRDFWIGDLDPYAAPVSCLLAPDYLAGRSALISLTSTIPTVVPGSPCTSEPVAPAEPEIGGGIDTTHFAVADRWGNVVDFTGTLTDGFGSSIVVPGYGFALNNSLANFNGTPLASAGNPGANDPGPGKRPKGNTAPVLVLDGSGDLVLATGSPGAVQIPSVVLNVVSNVIDFGLSGQEAVAAPRLWVNLNPNTNLMGWNAGLPESSIAALRALGQRLNAAPAVATAFGSAESLYVDTSVFSLAPVTDPRSAPDAFGGVVVP